MSPRQVRISDDLADRLAEAIPGSLSAAAEAAITWALDNLDAAQDPPPPGPPDDHLPQPRRRASASFGRTWRSTIVRH